MENRIFRFSLCLLTLACPLCNAKHNLDPLLINQTTSQLVEIQYLNASRFYICSMGVVLKMLWNGCCKYLKVHCRTPVKQKIYTVLISVSFISSFNIGMTLAGSEGSCIHYNIYSQCSNYLFPKFQAI